MLKANMVEIFLAMALVPLLQWGMASIIYLYMSIISSSVITSCNYHITTQTINHFLIHASKHL